MVPIDGPRRSKRTFAGSWEPTEPVDFNKLMRVREPVSQSRLVCRARSPTCYVGARGTRSLKTNSELFASSRPRHGRTRGRSSHSFYFHEKLKEEHGIGPSYACVQKSLQGASR